MRPDKESGEEVSCHSLAAVNILFQNIHLYCFLCYIIFYLEMLFFIIISYLKSKWLKIFFVKLTQTITPNFSYVLRFLYHSK